VVHQIEVAIGRQYPCQWVHVVPGTRREVNLCDVSGGDKDIDERRRVAWFTSMNGCNRHLSGAHSWILLAAHQTFGHQNTAASYGTHQATRAQSHGGGLGIQCYFDSSPRRWKYEPHPSPFHWSFAQRVRYGLYFFEKQRVSTHGPVLTLEQTAVFAHHVGAIFVRCRRRVSNARQRHASR
jgi:hypothetical protein